MSRPSGLRILGTNTKHMKRGLMSTNFDVNAVDKKIQSIRQIASELKEIGRECPALDRNLVRLSASIKMLELNFSDVASLDA